MSCVARHDHSSSYFTLILGIFWEFFYHFSQPSFKCSLYTLFLSVFCTLYQFFQVYLKHFIKISVWSTLKNIFFAISVKYTLKHAFLVYLKKIFFNFQCTKKNLKNTL